MTRPQLPPLQIVNTGWGADEFTLASIFTCTDGSDLTGDLMEINLGTDAGPSATWIPSSDTRTYVAYTPPDPFGVSTASISLLITSAVAAGDYRVYARLTDHPEVLLRALGRLRVIA